MSIYGDKISVANNGGVDKAFVQDVLNEQQWVDGNSDGVADGWTLLYGTPSILSYPAQKVEAVYYTPLEEYFAEIQRAFQLYSSDLFKLEIEYLSTQILLINEVGTYTTFITSAPAAQYKSSFNVLFRPIDKGGIKFKLQNPTGTADYFILYKVKLFKYSEDNLVIS